MENQHNQSPKKGRPFFSILLLAGFFIILLGIGGVILGKGVNFVTPLLQQPGPTGIMIQPEEKVSDALKQPGILGELKSFEVEGSNFKFTPNAIVVNEGDTVQISFNNVQGIHNFVIEGINVQTKTIQAGESEQVTFTAPKKGTYVFYCSVGNHRAMGMEGTLVVN